MQKRKTIAVIAADVANDYMNRILVGISEQSKVLGYDVYAFIMTFSTDGDSLIQYGEENVFSLIRPDVIDGLIRTQQEGKDWLLAELKYRFLTEQGILK